MTLSLIGKVSWFGGPFDHGVDPAEGLAFIYDVADAPHLFLSKQPPGTTGLARRLAPFTNYIACRWDYNVYPRMFLLEHTALIKAVDTGKQVQAYPADWGPHIDTERVADVSPGVMKRLGIVTDDVVEVTFPYTGEQLMATFRRKPTEIEAWRYSPTIPMPVWVARKAHRLTDGDPTLTCNTAQGPVEAQPGDWIIKGTLIDEVYPCKNEVFEATYDPV